MEPTSSPLPPIAASSLVYECIKKHPSGLFFLYKQLILKPVGSIPIQVAHRVTEVDPKTLNNLFGQLTTFEVHALFISMMGWEPFIQEINLDRASLEKVEAACEEINKKIPVLNGAMINIMRWIEIRLPSLLLKHKKANQNQAVPMLTKDFKERQVPKEKLIDLILKSLHIFFAAFQGFLINKDVGVFKDQLNNNIFTNKFGEITRSILTSEAHSEISSLIKILKDCLTFPEALFPLLLEAHSNNEMFPDYQSSLLEDLTFLNTYLGEKISTKIREVSGELANSFLEILRDFGKISTQINIEREKLGQIIQTKSFFCLINQQETFLEKELIENSARHFFWLNEFEKRSNKKGLEELHVIVHKYRIYLYDQYKIVTENINNSRAVVLQVKKLVEQLGFEIKNFHSGTFSIIDFILIKLNEQATPIYKYEGAEKKNILQLVEQTLSRIFHFNEFIDKNFSHLSPEQKLTLFESLVGLISQLRLNRESLKNMAKIHKNFNRVATPFINSLDIIITIFNEFRSIDLLDLLNTPIKETNPEPSPTEWHLLEKQLKILSELLNYNFVQLFLLLEKHVSTSYNFSSQSLADWRERSLKLLAQEDLLLEHKIQLYISCVEEVIEFFENISNCIPGLSPVIEIITDSLKTTFVKGAKPLLRFALKRELLSETEKKAPSSKRKKRKGRSSNIKKPQAKAPSPHPILRQVFIPSKLLNLNASSSPEMAISKETHEREVKKSYLEFQQKWKDLHSVEKLNLIRSLCKRVPIYEFQKVHYGVVNEGEIQFESIKNEAKSNLQSSVEDLLTHAQYINAEKITAHQFSFIVLRMSIAIEQAIKLLFTRSNPLDHVHKHQLGLLYQELEKNHEQIQFPLPLSADQINWLNSLDAIIDISGRYSSKSFDFMMQGVSQILYLSNLEPNSLSKKEQNQARLELCHGLEISFSEQESLPSLIQKGWKYVQENRRRFFENGMEVLKNLLLSVDVEQMSSVSPEELTVKIELSLLPGICKDLQIQSKSTQLAMSHSIIPQLNKTESKLYEGQKLHRLHLSHFNSNKDFKLKTEISSVLKECGGALEGLKNLFLYLYPNDLKNRNLDLANFSSRLGIKGSNAYSWGLSALLKEAVLIESILQALMGYLPLFDEGEGSSHLLFTDFRGKPFCHSHQLQKFLDRIKPYTKELPATIIDQLEDRIKILEPILKKLYRYNSDALSESQQLLNQLRFLDQLNFSLSKGMLRPEQKEELESITKGFSIDLANLDATIEEFIEGKIIRSLPSTLQAVDNFLDILMLRLKKDQG